VTSFFIGMTIGVVVDALIVALFGRSAILGQLTHRFCTPDSG
jgi:hypothetical protein